ncbi:MAG: EF-P beta-lysylation protein EpmB [Gammaproteobacteria bacterium]
MVINTFIDAMTDIDPPLPEKNWQRQLAEAFDNISDLCRYLELDSESLPVSAAAAADFPLRVPRAFAANMEKGNADDPLLRQVLPIDDETATYPGYSADPVGDLAAAHANAIIHKYRGRALMINTGSCAINCRYCFRRNFPYADYRLTGQKLDPALAYLRADTTLSEVILSGGDPLVLSDDKLQHLFEQLNGIGHVRRIRIHSRLPIVLPARVTDALCELLAASPKTVVMVVHCNHANEIAPNVIDACRKLKHHGIVLFNQAVLLKGVNDDAETLIRLHEALFATGIVPYYLHLLDRAKGVGHFDVSETDALVLMDTLRQTLPGYLVPKLVKEVAGAPAKLPVA